MRRGGSQREVNLVRASSSNEGEIRARSLVSTIEEGSGATKMGRRGFRGVVEVTRGSSGDRSPSKLVGAFEVTSVGMEIAEVSRKVEFGNQQD
ncbi:hypothetical protein U1Q18_041463 [Sarracenia purpurea var. burkii]